MFLQDKTLSAAILPDADTSSAKSALDEENTSSISDAQTIETTDSSNDTEDIVLETILKPQETVANGPLTLEVCKDFIFSESIGILFHATVLFVLLNTQMSSLGCLLVKCCVFSMMDRLQKM